MVDLEHPAPVQPGPRRPAFADPFRAAWTAATAALVAATGVAQLTGNGTGRVLLAVVLAAALAALGLRLTRGRPRVAELEAGLADARVRADTQDRAIRRYRAAVERIVDRQFPLFREEVELTVAIGARAGEDLVVERHRTTPDPYVVHRLVRPVTVIDGATRPAFEELALTCEVDGQDVAAEILPVSETAAGVLVLILFRPGLRRTVEWSLRYRAPRLWDPLRADGFDRLSWSPGTLDGGEEMIAVTDLTVHFVFPPGAGDPGVRECAGAGSAPTRAGATGERRVTWHDPAPATRRYEWELWADLTIR